MSWIKDLVTMGASFVSGPVAPVVLGAINAFLDDDDKVDESTPIAEVQMKVEKMTPEQQSKVSEAYYAYMIEKRKYEHLDNKVELTTDKEKLDILELSDSGDNAVRPETVRTMVQIFKVIIYTFLTIKVLMAIGIPFLALHWVASFAETDAVRDMIVKNGIASLHSLTDWTAMLALAYPPLQVVQHYFNDRSLDKANRLNIMRGIPATQSGSLLGSITQKLIRK